LGTKAGVMAKKKEFVGAEKKVYFAKGIRKYF
jgi:hypothetical protein